MSLRFLMFACLALAPAAASAQVAPPPFQGPVLAQDRVLARAIETLTVSSPVIAPGGPIPLVNSGYGKSTSFPLSWTPGPKGTQSYAVIMEDPESHLPQPTLHWLAYNIPADVTALPRAIRDRGQITAPKPFLQGRNSKGGVGYVGPHPAPGDPPHHYHIQVFALRKMLPLNGSATLDQVIAAMNERVLAEGELIGTFQAPPAEDAKVKTGP